MDRATRAGSLKWTGDDGYALSIVRHRCPEICDAVMPVATVQLILDVVDELAARFRALQEPAGGQDDVEEAICRAKRGLIRPPR